MSNKLKTLIAIVCFAPILILVGCAGFQNAIMYQRIAPEMKEYTNDSGLSLMPWTTIADGIRLEHKMEYKHLEFQKACERMAVDDVSYVDYLRKEHTFHREQAIQVRDFAFDPSGPLGFLAVAGLAGTGGALLIKRPGDKSKKELENGNTVVNNSS